MADDNIQWTHEEMLENAGNWSLAGDVALLNSLKKFSRTLISGTESLNVKVNTLMNDLENVGLKLELTKNQFHSLRNTQFIENRVYEDDETLGNDEDKPKEKEITEEDKENALKNAISKSLEVIRKCYDRVELSGSDSEGEGNGKNYVLQPKDLYADRPLPHLVGTEEWYKKWHVGLLPSESESESEKEEEDVYSSDSNSEEFLPKNRNLGSETSSELDFANRNAGPIANSTFNDTRRDLFDSSEEQSNSVPVTTPISNEKFAEQLAAKLGDVISGKAETSDGGNITSPTRIIQPTKYGPLFPNEPPPLDDAVLPKVPQESLFSDGKNLFDENNESGLFSIKKGADEQKPSVPKQRVTRSLFDNSDSSSEEDMVTVTEKRKVLSATVSSSNPYMPPYKTPSIPFVDDQPPEITVKNSLKKKSLFDESSDDEMFSKAKIVQPPENPLSGSKKLILFEDSDDFTPPQPEKTDELNIPKPASKEIVQKSAKKISLFDDDDDFYKEEEDIFATVPKKKSLFDDSAHKQDDVKSKSLFDDFETPLENDLFNVTTNPSTIIENKIEEPPEKEIISEDKPENIQIQSENISSVSSEGNIQHLKHNSEDITKSKLKRNLGLFDSESENSAEEDIFGKNASPNEPKEASKSTRKDSEEPPPINLFDPTPPPVDWDASSEHSAESDTFSLTEGLLEHTNYSNQTQATSSSLFDEAPPSLDVNDLNYSSGIVRDINITRVETDDSSSFYPHASSSRRLSSDIFSDQQSQDSFFISKNPGDSQGGHQISNLDKIPEHSEDSTSKIWNLTPSGNVADFEDTTSVFERSEDESNGKMYASRPLPPKKPDIIQKVSLFTDHLEEKTKNDVTKEGDSPSFKPSPGKLKHNLNINVSALLPGAARPSIVKSASLDETDKSPTVSPPAVRSKSPSAVVRSKSEMFTSQIIEPEPPEGGTTNFGTLGETEVLQSITKDRAKIPIKRRPSTRRARQEAVRRSSDFSLRHDVEEMMSTSTDAVSVPNDSEGGIKDRNPDNYEAKQPEDFKEGVSLVFDKNLETKTVTSDDFKSPLFDDLDEEEVHPQDPKDPKKTLFESSSEHSDIFEETKHDDLFSSKLAVPPPGNNSEQPQKSSLFSDKSDSDSDGDLFGAKTKFPTGPAEKRRSANAPTTKRNIFDSEDSSEEDLFGSKTTRSSGAAVSFKEEKGSTTTSSKRVETKTANVRKLENKGVTDFDPLIATSVSK